MSKISTYEVTPVPKLADKLIGTSVGGEIEDITYNFTLSELLNLFIPNIPANTLQGVLDYGNEATQDIILNGTIFTTYIEVTDTATILNSYLTGDTHILGGLYDSLDSIGTAGQVLISTGDGIEWYSVPTITPDLQQVLTSGNTADVDIVLDANLEAIVVSANAAVIGSQLTVQGTLMDYNESTGTSGQVLASNSTTVQWIDLPVYSALSPLHIDTITHTLSIQQAGSTQSGYLSSADWISFDGKQSSISLTTVGSSGPASLVGTTINVPNYTLSGLGGVPQTRTLTINGVTYNLSADRTWTIAAGVSSVTATTPLFSTGGVNPDISIQQSSSSLDGYLSNVDWLTFNSKQPAGNYITSLTGEATAAGPGAAAVTLSNAAVIGKLLTGLNLAAGGTISATDSILIAFGKTQNQISALVGGVIFKGTWNASTNTPTLVSSVGVQGNYYIVNVAGNTNLNGITDWQVGDWAIFNGTVWDKVDNTDAVSSVNGFTGAVNLTTDNIPEGATNLYYTNTRARAALSFVAGSGAYNNTTGVITIPTNNNQITNGANYITLASLSAVSPLSYINTTGVFSISQATTSTNGYLSSTDWNTFNNKQATITLTTTGTSGAATLVGATLNIPQYQAALTNPVTGTGTTNYVPKFTAASAIGNSNIQDSGTLITLGSNTTISSGGLGIGSTDLTVYNLHISKNQTGAVTAYGIMQDGVVLSDVTTIAYLNRTLAQTQAATFTLSNLTHYFASQGTFGAGSTVTNQTGFHVASTLAGAVTNYGFRGQVASSASNWNLYMDGTANNYLAGNLGIGSASIDTSMLRISRSFTSTLTSSIFLDSQVSSTATSVNYINTSASTAAATYTISAIRHINLTQGTFGAGSTVTDQYGIIVGNLTGATNNYGFFGNISAAANRWNLYMAGTANNYMAGSLGIGTTSLTGYTLRLSKNITGSTASFAARNEGVVQSDVTSDAIGFRNDSNTAAAAFTLVNYWHFWARQGSIGAGSAITNQYGYVVDSNMVGATNNYAFQGNIPSGTNRWNLYMGGTANNYMAGQTGVGTTTLGSYIFNVGGSVATLVNFNSTNASGFYTTYSTSGTERAYIGLGANTISGLAISDLGIVGSSNIVIASGSGGTETMRIDSTKRIGIGTGASINASAKVQIDSTTQGFLLPRMTSAQRTAISSPATGLIVYQTDGVEGLWLNTSTGWRELTVV